jgi:hypothetical protein
LRGLFVGRVTDPVTSSLDNVLEERYDYSMCSWFTNQGLVEAPESYNQKHSISCQGPSPRLSLSPAKEVSLSDLISNSKSFPSCKYLKTAEHFGLANFEVTVLEHRGYARGGGVNFFDDFSRDTSQHELWDAAGFETRYSASLAHQQVGLRKPGWRCL